MSLNFFESNQIEQLIPELCQQLKKNKSLLQPHRFVISGFGMQQWLIQSISHTQGIFANASFQFPQDFIQGLATLFGLPTTKFFTTDALCLRLYQLFKQECRKPQSQFLSTDYWQYLQIPDESILNRRLLELSLNCAQVFDEYQWHRPDWLHAWQNRDYSQPNNVPKTLKQTQQNIWQYLIKQQGFAETYDSKSQQLYKIAALLENISDTDRQKLYDFAPQINIFGLNAMQHPIWTVSQALSKSIDINFYQFNPSRELWSEQLFSPYYENQLQQKSINSSTTIDLFNLHHPLLMILGQSSSGFQQLFIQHEHKLETKKFINPINNKSKIHSLLHCCQQRILEDSKEPFNNCAGEDNSLSIHYCQDKQQELVQLRLALFTWLAENKDASFRDVLIVAPNMQDYTAWIPTVFADTPHAVADTKDQHHSLFANFLTLLNSDFSLNDIQIFWTSTKNYSQQTEQLNELLLIYKKFGFRSGANTQHRYRMGFDDSRSLTETIADIWQTIFSSANQNLPSLPLPKLSAINSELLTLSQYWQEAQQHKTLEQWLNQWQLWIQKIYKNEQDTKQCQLLNSLVDDLRETARLCNFEETINFQQMQQLWQYKTSYPSVFMQYMDNKLPFSDMLPISGIPKKFIAILGLNAGFPQNQSTNSFNLSHYQPRPTDRNISHQQRYQFLEYISSAREVLWLSYSTTDQQKDISPILKDLQEYITTARSTPKEERTLKEQEHPKLNQPVWRCNLKTKPLKAKKPFNPSIKKSPNKILSIARLSELLANPLHTFYQRYKIRDSSPRILDDLYQSRPSALDNSKIIPEIYRLLLCYPDTNNEQVAQHLMQELAINTNNYLTPRLLNEQLHELIAAANPNLPANWQDHKQILHKHLTTPHPVYLYSQTLLQHEQQNLLIGYRFKAQSVVHSWLYHLMTEAQQTTTFLFFERDKPKTLSFQPLEKDIKNEYLQNIMHTYHKLLQEPILVFPELLTHFLQHLNWNKALQQKTYDKDSYWQKILSTSQVYDFSEQGKIHLAHEEFKQQIFGKYL